MKAGVVQEYLDNMLKHTEQYVLSPDEKRIVDQDVRQFIAQKLLRKKFRKQKLHPNTIKDISKKVDLCVSQNKPLHAAIPFGGYKHFWNPSHPNPDWAELFTLKFLTEWVAPVLAVHPPGVIIEFISEDLIIPRMDNYPEEALEQYAKNFSLLLDIYKKYIPKNLKINYFRIGDRVDKQKMIADVEKTLPGSWQKWNTYSKQEKEIELKRSIRSVLWKGKTDLTTLSSAKKQERLIESRLLELAYYEVEARPEYLGDYFSRENHFGICFSFGLSPDNIDHWITLGSTHASTVDFWIGRGILEERETICIPRIVSHRQYDKIKDTVQKVRTDSVRLPNFQSIDVFSGELHLNC